LASELEEDEEDDEEEELEEESSFFLAAGSALFAIVVDAAAADDATGAAAATSLDAEEAGLAAVLALSLESELDVPEELEEEEEEEEEELEDSSFFLASLEGADATSFFFSAPALAFLASEELELLELEDSEVEEDSSSFFLAAGLLAMIKRIYYCCCVIKKRENPHKFDILKEKIRESKNTLRRTDRRRKVVNRRREGELEAGFVYN